MTLQSPQSPAGLPVLRRSRAAWPDCPQRTRSGSRYLFSLFVSAPLCAQLLCRVQVFVAPWTAAHQAPLSMGSPMQKHWSRLPFPPLGDLPSPEVESVFPALTVNPLPLSHLGSPSSAHSHSVIQSRFCSCPGPSWCASKGLYALFPVTIPTYIMCFLCFNLSPCYPIPEAASLPPQAVSHPSLTSALSSWATLDQGGFCVLSLASTSLWAVFFPAVLRHITCFLLS